MNKFIQDRLEALGASLIKNEEKFVKDFVSFSQDSRFSEENARKIIAFLTNPANYKIGSTVIADGLKVNIDWAALKEYKEVNPELHKLWHDIHIPTFDEVMFIIPAGAKLKEIVAFDESKDIGFYELPKNAQPEKIEPYGWMFVQTDIYHAPLYGIRAYPQDCFYEEGKQKVVKVIIKILGDRIVSARKVSKKSSKVLGN